MNIIKFKNKQGFTLVELLIAGGVMAGLALATAQLLEMAKKNEKKSENLTAKNLSTQEFKKNLAIGNLDWRLFAPKSSYYFDNNKVRSVQWVSGLDSVPSLSEIGFETNFKHDVVKKSGFFGLKKTIVNMPFVFYRDAHSLELLRANPNDERRLAFTRCVPRSQKMTNLKQLYNLPLKPFPQWENQKLKIFCCDTNNISCKSNEIKGENSDYQLKTVIYKNQDITILPRDNDLFVDGMGFFLVFNNGKNPTNYELMSFAYLNKCKMNNEANKKCSLPFDLETQMKKGDSQGVQDLGVLKIR